MDADQLHRVRRALRDAEAWTAKWIADNHEQVKPGMPFEAARRALDRISATYSEIGRLPR